mgnify:FL=1
MLTVVLLPTALLVVMLMDKNKLKNSKFQAMFGSAYEHIKTKSRWTLAYTCVFTFRRLFVLVLIFYVKT